MPLRKPIARPTPADAAEAYAVANLRPSDTGLPMVVWVSERGNARHDVRVKVARAHGPRAQFNDTASIAVRLQPRLAAGQLATAGLDAVTSWIALNRDVIIDYWDGAIGTVEVGSASRALGLRRCDPAPESWSQVWSEILLGPIPR
jgi:hypothetical protein